VPPPFFGPQILLGHMDNGAKPFRRQASENRTLPIPGKELVAMALPEQTNHIDGLLIRLPQGGVSTAFLWRHNAAV
jgi:hypothetical protein